MKNDLISKSELIEFLKEVTVTDGITFETGFKQILTDIENQPIAYDLDEIVRQLEENTMTVYAREYRNIDVVDIDTLTDILKAGVVNE